MKHVYKVLPICLIVLGLVYPGCKPSSTAQLEENKALIRRTIKELEKAFEGYKRSSYPKILCANTAEEAEAALKEISNIVMVSGLISGDAEEKELFESKSPSIKVNDFEKIVSVLKQMLAQETS